MTEDMVENRIKSGIRFGKDGIVRINLPADIKLGLAETKALMAVLEEYAQGEKIPVVVDFRGRQGYISNREARVYAADEENTQMIQAVAFMIGSPASKMIVNFFLGVYKPSFPVRSFTSEEAAVEWLKGFLETED